MFFSINVGEKTLNCVGKEHVMYDLIQQYFIDFEEASKITQISIGISLSILMTLISRLLLRGPVMKVISSSDNLYDDRIFILATPLLNVGVFLIGIWFTFDYVFEEKSFERVAFAGSSAAILLILFAPVSYTHLTLPTILRV